MMLIDINISTYVLRENLNVMVDTNYKTKIYKDVG